MKKIFSILSLVLMFACCNLALTSCGDDNEDEIPEDKVVNKLAGTWEYYEPGYPNTVHSLTLNEYGTFTSFTKDIVFDPNSTETDKEGYLFKYKGKYTISNNKLILNYESAYEPILLEDPNEAKWLQEDRSTEATFELQEGNNVMRVIGVNKDRDAFVEIWKKVK